MNTYFRLYAWSIWILSPMIGKFVCAQSIPRNASIFVNKKGDTLFVAAGADRDVMLGGKTYLSGQTRSASPVLRTAWTKTGGPGEVRFGDSSSAVTTAAFSAPGVYTLTFSAWQDALQLSSAITVKVVNPPPAKRLDVVYTKHYSIDSRLWNDRAKAIIVKWIPYCIHQCERTDLTTGQGGLDNFIEAAKALRGEPHGKHKGYVFANAWVHQTVEAMCEALMVDPKDDTAMIAAQQKMRLTLERWIPIILAAQEPDGYLQTAFTLRDTSKWHERWSPQGRENHEGYTAGYFIESAINPDYSLRNNAYCESCSSCGLVFFNLFIGSKMRVEKVAGRDVEMIQQTDYPWNGKGSLTINPATSSTFTVYIRVPNRTTSVLYTPSPVVKGLLSLSVNGHAVTPVIDHGYAVLRRTWKKGDRVDFELPMAIQQVKADEKIKADSGRIALRYGPLLYSVETADRQDITQPIGPTPLTLEWNGNLLHGVMVIKGQWADGTPLLAIPNYARLNRTPTTATPDYGKKTPSSIVWIKQ